jgi:L-ascorbate metabolism protein UlaG (beta-lactamase superfamily)
MDLRLTHVGTATLLLELGGLRLLTDPALDPAGADYRFAPCVGSHKSEAPALPPGGLGRLDALLVSHDHHADNLDAAGRALLPTVPKVLTTCPGARRLGPPAVGLAPWQSHDLEGPDGTRVTVTATPARHGPAGITLVDSVTIGFLLSGAGLAAPLWISGDTVWFSGIAEVARRCAPVGLAVVHVGDVGFAATGPARFTFDGAQAARAAKAVGAATIVPVHYSGWRHFRQGRAEAEAAFAAEGLTDRVRWLPRGEPITLQV